MVQFYDSITDELRDWALSQPLFFTASAPLTGSHVNISPKGLPASSFAILSPRTAAYVDATGSGSETIAHVYENGRVTVMFCSFERSPRILRFFCWGRVVEWDEGGFEGWVGRMGRGRVEGARAVVVLRVWKVQTSCGFGVPLLTTVPSPNGDTDHPSNETPVKPALLDRDTMGHWAHRKIETNTLLEYQQKNNSASLDGCPGLRSALRDGGERVWVVLVKAWVRRVAGQREALGVGVLVGVVGVVSVMVLGGWLGVL